MADRLSEGAGTDRVEGPRHPYRGGGTSEVQRLYVRTHARACSVGWRATYVRTYLRTYTGVRSERATSLPGPGARAYARATRAQTYTHVRTCVRTAHRAWHEEPHLLADRLSECERWGPKELRACIRTRTHGVKQRATGARAYVCASARVRTYVLRGRLLSLSAVRAHTMHVRTYVQTRVRACDRGGDMRGHARTVRTHARGARETRT